MRAMYTDNNTNVICRFGTIRIIAFLLFLVLFTTGCAGGDNNQNSKTGDTSSSVSGVERSSNISVDEIDNDLTDIEDLSEANAAAAAEAEMLPDGSEWITFLLLCNEGMNNTGSNVGNTLMAVSMNADIGKIRLMMLTWDTFIEYEGYDIPQIIDMAYRNGGPEEAVKVFDDNFDAHIDRFMSLNFLNLASLIDAYGGVTVDVTRAERNALNGMVASKRRELQAKAGNKMISQHVMEMMEGEYHLNEFGPETKLNGLQAVGFGWLQYDSVYNCCERETDVVAALFRKISEDISEQAIFYTNSTDLPDASDHRRPINLDSITDDDKEFLTQFLSPIIQKSYNNMTSDEFMDMALTLARTAYMASREGVDIFDNIDHAIFPLEAKKPYDIVAGTEGHLIDYDENKKEMKKFLYTISD